MNSKQQLNWVEHEQYQHPAKKNIGLTQQILLKETNSYRLCNRKNAKNHKLLLSCTIIDKVKL